MEQFIDPLHKILKFAYVFFFNTIFDTSFMAQMRIWSSYLRMKEHLFFIHRHFILHFIYAVADMAKKKDAILTRL